MKRGKPRHSEVEQQDEGRWSTGHRYITSGVLQLPQKMVQAVDLNHEEGQRRLARGSTPASEAAKWRRAAPASSRHQDSEGTLGQTQTAICLYCISGMCHGKCRRDNALAHTSAQAGQRGGGSGRGAPKSTPSGQPADHPEPRSMAEEAHHKGLGNEPI